MSITDINLNDREELEIGTDLSDMSGRHFKKEPAINVISKEEFEERVDKVFKLLWETLSKSFGPYGAPTLIYSYPYQHVTKDGYTIMKNISMDASETLVDQAIADMAGDICGRLNYAVGDGTTSAIIATNSIYQSYLDKKEELDNLAVLPRDIIHRYNVLKNDILNKLQTKIRSIQSDDLDELAENIRDVVYISSNGDEEMTSYISDIYKEIGAPAITCSLASDGITKSEITHGYQYELVLNDRLYINSDDDTMKLENADVIIFSTKITKKVYENILKPLNEESRTRGRNLLVCAPLYDEVTLRQVISVDLNREYKQHHSINMILTTYKAISEHHRKLLQDFAVLMNTFVIDRAMEEIIMDQLAMGNRIHQVFNIDDRKIDGLTCIGIQKGEETSNAFTYKYNQDELPVNSVPLPEFAPLTDQHVDLGYVASASIGLKTSEFLDLVYDQSRYDAVLKEAKSDLDAKVKKYEKLGTFNIEVTLAQQRYYNLKLKMGRIEVGADSELSQKLLKDAVDDSILAAASAFNHGVVLGCNTNLIQAIMDVDNEITDNGDINEDIDHELLQILIKGFKSVYKTVLGNAFNDTIIEDTSIVEMRNFFIDKIKPLLVRNHGSDVKVRSIFDYDTLDEVFSNIDGHTSVHDVLVEYSLKINKVFDISKMDFSDTVINSAKTDEEILKATIDLITILIIGNQMVITGKHNF